MSGQIAITALLLSPCEEDIVRESADDTEETDAAGRRDPTSSARVQRVQGNQTWKIGQKCQVHLHINACFAKTTTT